VKQTQKLQCLPENIAYDVMNSPVGTLTILASPMGVHRILWQHEISTQTAKGAMLATIKHDPHLAMILKVKQQLTEYFQGKRQVFDVPICLEGSAFQIQAWQELRKIPYGQTISYKEQARRIGDTRKARAVGMANGANPISIIVPCHRVIGSNGKLTGFGGGLENKAFLLHLESKA
jgi:methylated-DNA-[protein]-cysteine S-methyltransferase